MSVQPVSISRPPTTPTAGSLRAIRQAPSPKPSVDAERLHRKQLLAASFRLFARYGYDQGVAGHITARDPEWPDHFWVNPFGVYFGHIRVSDLILVSDTGDVVIGEHPVNRAAFAIHSAIHKARPDVIAAAHSHSTYGKAWSTLGRLLDPLTQDACAFFEDHVLFEEYSGVVLDTGEGDRIAAKLGPHKAAILQNHGLLTVGASVDSAVWRFIAMEDAARVQILAEAAGTPKPLPLDIARHTAAQVGGDGWFSFQPLWNLITREQPDLFE
jgi:ribulose-5-phosphate 4-epimerase/fuculose-1-phosphate aldolase